MGILLSGSLRHVQGHAARLVERHHGDVGAGAAVFPLPVGPAVGDFHLVSFDELLAHVGKKGPGKGRQALTRPGTERRWPRAVRTRRSSPARRFLSAWEIRGGVSSR